MPSCARWIPQPRVSISPGLPKAPKDVRESVTQASASASRASILLSKSQFSVEAITAVVDEDLCKKCGLCADVCPFGAIAWQKKQVAQRDQRRLRRLWHLCGRVQVRRHRDAPLFRPGDLCPDRRHPGERSSGQDRHLCLQLVLIRWGGHRWCEPAWPTHQTRASSAPCAPGRVSSEFVWYAFKRGAPVVLVSGCHYVDCHYIDANRSTVRRVDGLWDGLEKAGLRPDRLQLEWCSAAEGPRWQTIMVETEKKRQSVLPEEMERTREVLTTARVPGPRNPRPQDIGQPAEFVCMRCGYQWADLFEIKRAHLSPVPLQQRALASAAQEVKSMKTRSRPSNQPQADRGLRQQALLNRVTTTYVGHNRVQIAAGDRSFEADQRTHLDRPGARFCPLELVAAALGA